MLPPTKQQIHRWQRTETVALPITTSDALAIFDRVERGIALETFEAVRSDIEVQS